MKKTLFLLSVELLNNIMSFNDDTESGSFKEAVLSTLFRNDKLELKYLFNSNQLERLRETDISTGQ